jgi:hypothetical protein
MVSPGDLQLFTITDDTQEAIDMILEYQQKVGPPEETPETLA